MMRKLSNAVTVFQTYGRACEHPDHRPPATAAEPGLWQHTCDGCSDVTHVVVMAGEAKQTAERLFNRELLHHFVNGEEVDCDDPRNLIQQEVNAMVRAGWRITFHGWRGDQVCYRFEKDKP